ncbi:MAG: cyclic nucleotide-binding domain-containing protein [Prevotellaceae bacterium]|jgi:CRP-like cAMP-binding protein|nr:cyclic nucleotide-binding domain-containing protein [Prevotellaceae bacterium]
MNRKASTLIEHSLHSMEVLPRSVHLPDKEKGIIDNLYVRRSLLKNEVIRTNTADEYVYFIEEGALGSFVSVNDKKKMHRILLEGSFTGLTLWTNDMPTPSFQALSNSIVWRANLRQFIDFCLQSPLMNSVYLKLIEHEISERSYLWLLQVTCSPIERYLKLLKSHRKLFQAVPLKYLASYINVTPQSLSRLRRRIK